MPDSSVNRLELHWPQKAPPPNVPQYEPESWSEMANTWEERFQNYLSDHPKLTVAAAAAIGLALGWMVKRK